MIGLIVTQSVLAPDRPFFGLLHSDTSFSDAHGTPEDGAWQRRRHAECLFGHSQNHSQYLATEMPKTRMFPWTRENDRFALSAWNQRDIAITD